MMSKLVLWQLMVFRDKMCVYDYFANVYYSHSEIPIQEPISKGADKWVLTQLLMLQVVIRPDEKGDYQSNKQHLGAS